MSWEKVWRMDLQTAEIKFNMCWTWDQTSHFGVAVDGEFLQAQDRQSRLYNGTRLRNLQRKRKSTDIATYV